MLIISGETMLLVGALCGFVGFANIFLAIGYGVYSALNLRPVDVTKLRKFTDDDWPSSGDV